MRRLRRKAGPVIGVLLALACVGMRAAERVDVNSLVIVPAHLLDREGFSCDLAFNPVDHSLAVAWVRDGDIHYVTKDASNRWSAPEVVPDGGAEVYGQEEENWPRKCLALAVDATGISHLVFAERSGNLHYIRGTPGAWQPPVRILEKQGYTINISLVSGDDRLHCVFEDANRDRIYFLSEAGGVWGTPVLMTKSDSRGEYSSLTKGDDGTVYFLCRQGQREHYNVRFAYMGKDGEWVFVEGATDAPRRLGSGPGLAARDGRMYIAWSNSTGVNGPRKSEIYCAAAPVPGEVWTHRLGGPKPLFHEDTGDPHPRVAIFSEGTLLLMTAKGQEPRMMLWDGHFWTRTRAAPWGGRGNFIIQVACDGETAWVAASSSRSDRGEVSVTGVRNPAIPR